MSLSRVLSKELTREPSRQHHSSIPTKSTTESGRPTHGTQHVAKPAKKTSRSGAQVACKNTSRARTPASESSDRNGLETHRSVTPAPPSQRTPSLVSGSSASTFDSPRSNALRRKKSGAIGKYAVQKRLETENLEYSMPTAHPLDVLDRRDVDDSIFGIFPPSTSQQAFGTHAHESSQHRNFPGEHTTSVLAQGPSSTPSTTYTDSPFSHVPTPSSASSYSSAFAAVAGATRSPQLHCSNQSGLYLRHQEQSDEGTRSSPQAVRESSTSSSSTLRTSGHAESISTQRSKGYSSSQTSVNPAKAAPRNKLTKEPSTSSSRKRTIQIPPELAHLNVDLPKVPTRPSRDGISNISDMTGPSAVVQSDLPRLYTTYHKRTSSVSVETHGSDGSPKVTKRFGFPSRSSSRHASPRVDSVTSPLPTAVRSNTRSSSESIAAQAHNTSQVQREDSPAVESVCSPSKSSRCAFFSRRPKHGTKEMKKLTKKPERTPAKGPVAGTGHEGYGRFGIRGRTASNTSSISSRSPSSDSSISVGISPTTMGRAQGKGKHAVELDDFLKTRLAPVVLRGNGIKSGQADSMSDVPGVSREPISSKNLSPCLLPSAMETSEQHCARGGPSFGRRNNFESSDDDYDDDVQTQIPSRPSRWAPTNFSQESLRSDTDDVLPVQLKSENQYPSIRPSHRKESTSPAVPNTIRHEGQVYHQPLRGSLSPTSSGKRNFLQRVTASPRTQGKDGGDLQSRAVATKGSPMPIGHYAIAADVEPVDLAEVESLVHDVSTTPPVHEAMTAANCRTLDPPCRSVSTREQHNNDSPRRLRLSPVGRIPPVVSKRDRDRKLSEHSFSRPFVRSQPRPTVKPPGLVYTQIRDMASSVEGGGCHEVSSPDTWLDSNAPGPQNAVVHTSGEAEILRMNDERGGTQSDEFITFPDRKDSQQDDIWNEYDDFMDAVARPLDAPHSPYIDLLYNGQRSQYMPPPPTGLPPKTELPAPPGSVSQQVSRFLRPSLSPMTPDTISAWVSSYENRSTGTSMNCASLSELQRDSASWQRRSSLASVRDGRGSQHSRSASSPDASAPAQDAQGERYPDDDGHETYLAHMAPDRVHGRKLSNRMRHAALMTSKWLSFGRVLFSPANNELRFTSEARVLVIDGLSSDWSYYIARTYQAAEVYDMSIGPRRVSVLASGEADEPRNYRRIPITSMSTAFPFPRGFFNAVVLRFPPATTEESYFHCVSECKRVLRPGGHLEVAVLDLDLVNMGSRTRKAVKGLKTRMQIHDPSICLGNLSDVLMRMVGQNGFEGVRRCVVGVPAAGRMRSQDLSSSDSDPLVGPRGQNESVPVARKAVDLLSPLNGNPDGLGDFGNESDEGITTMIAKVGRWWYSSCYETALPPSDHSIWRERGLLHECEVQRTSFRLLICCAQKPRQIRRRTVSV